MDKDINIEEQSSVEDISEESAQLPINFLKVGVVENMDVKVYIHQSVCAALEEYSRSDTSKELGSILLGAYSTSLGNTAVMISQYIEAKYTDASASTLTFTHATWDNIHKEQAEKWPELRIVGWQHTHPGYGIFLSNYDMFIQENIFNLPFQIAYVIDPVQNIRGFFCWNNGHVEKLKGYYIYDEPGKIIVPPSDGTEEVAAKNNSEIYSDPKMKKRAIWAFAVLALACVALAIMVVFLGFRLSESKKQIDELFSSLHSLKEQIQTFSINQNSFNAEIDKKASSLESNLDETEKQLDSLKTQLSDALPKESEEVIVLMWYVVQEGDTLQSICANMNRDYEHDKDILLRLNGLSEEDELREGQTLILLKAGSN